MSTHIENVQVLQEEGKIVMTVTIPVNFNANKPLDYLNNEKEIQEATRQAGREATEVFYQAVADRWIATSSYCNEDGYSMRQDEVSCVNYVSAYGAIQIRRPNFVNDHTGAGEVPFEIETRMEEHRMTPMFQYICLQKCAQFGPLEVRNMLEQDFRIHVSHHLLDNFLETMGKRYQSVRAEVLRDVIAEDWSASWLPPVIRVCEGITKEQTNETASGCDASGRGTEKSGEEIKILQYDPMTVTIRQYEGDQEKGTRGLKYHTERHQLHNIVIGSLPLEGPRKAGDGIELNNRRYLSEYVGPEDMLGLARENLEADGLRLGDKILLQADGAENLWERMKAAFVGYDLVEILDERHCQKNLRAMADLAYPEEDTKNRLWVEKRMTELYEGEYEHFFDALNYLIRRTQDAEAKKALKTKRKYFRRNQKRIRYCEFLKAGYIISTCFVESGHRHVIGQRLRGNGRSYLEERLCYIADLRCEYKSNRLPKVFEEYLMKRRSDAA